MVSTVELEYRWQRVAQASAFPAEDIPGATSPTYQPTADDFGLFIRAGVRLAGSNDEWVWTTYLGPITSEQAWGVGAWGTGAWPGDRGLGLLKVRVGSWYDAKDSGPQLVVSRIDDADVATLGSSSAADTNDPVHLGHDGEHYVWLPGTEGNYVSAPAPGVPTSSLVLRWRGQQRTGRGFQTCIALHPTLADRAYHLRINEFGTVQLYGWDSANAAIQLGQVGLTAASHGEFVDGDFVDITASVDLVAQTVSWSWGPPEAPATYSEVDAFGAPLATLGTGSPALLEVGAREGGAAFPYLGAVHYAEVTHDGVLIARFDPGADIDTSANPDGGQSSWLSATGETWTVHRPATNLATAVIVRPPWVYGGDDFLELPAADRPTFTATTGKHSVIVAGRTHALPSSWVRLWEAEWGSNMGPYLGIVGGGSSIGHAYCRLSDDGNAKSTSLVSQTPLPLGRLNVIAVVFDEGTMSLYADWEGRIGPTDITTVDGLIMHDVPRVGWGFSGELFAVRSFPGVALTVDELDAIADTIRNDYA